MFKRVTGKKSTKQQQQHPSSDAVATPQTLDVNKTRSVGTAGQSNSGKHNVNAHESSAYNRRTSTGASSSAGAPVVIPASAVAAMVRDYAADVQDDVDGADPTGNQPQGLQRNLFVSRSGRYKSKARQRAKLMQAEQEAVAAVAAAAAAADAAPASNTTTFWRAETSTSTAQSTGYGNSGGGSVYGGVSKSPAVGRPVLSTAV